jgi:hypothetical protein
MVNTVNWRIYSNKQKKHDIAHWSVIKHANNKDLVMLTKPRKRYNNQTFMEVGMDY